MRFASINFICFLYSAKYCIHPPFNNVLLVSQSHSLKNSMQNMSESVETITFIITIQRRQQTYRNTPSKSVWVPCNSYSLINRRGHCTHIDHQALFMEKPNSKKVLQFVFWGRQKLLKKTVYVYDTFNYQRKTAKNIWIHDRKTPSLNSASRKRTKLTVKSRLGLFVNIFAVCLRGTLSPVR